MKQCNLCPLAVKEQVAGIGSLAPKLIVVGNYPAREDEKTLKPFSVNAKGESASAILYRTLANMKLTKEEVYLTYALRCNPYRHGIEAKPAHISVCATNNLHPELSKVDCPIILALGNAALLSLLPEATGGVAHHRCKWHRVVIGGKERFVRVSFPLEQVERMSLWNLEENPKTGKLERYRRWNPIGSCGWFFQQDIKAVLDKLQETKGV